MLREELTQRQKQVFDVIANQLSERGYPPTIRDLCAELDIASPNGVVCHLRALEKKGWIERDKESARGIRVPGQFGHTSTRMQLRGRVSAGMFHEAIEQDEEIDIPSLFGIEGRFISVVLDDSMEHRSISRGDYLVHTEGGKLLGVIRKIN